MLPSRRRRRLNDKTEIQEEEEVVVEEEEDVSDKRTRSLFKILHAQGAIPYVIFSCV